MSTEKINSKNISDIPALELEGLCVIKYKNESIESLMKRFKKKIRKDGNLIEYSERQHYKRPGQKKREKSAKAKTIREQDGKVS